jgi:hypothetical protein
MNKMFQLQNDEPIPSRLPKRFQLDWHETTVLKTL